MLRRSFIALASTAFLMPQTGFTEEAMQTPEALISGLTGKHGTNPVLLYLHTPDCGYCGIVWPAIETAVQGDKLKKQNWQIESVDVSQNPELLQALAKTKDVPACVAVINGKTYAIVTGLQSGNEWENLLARAMEAANLQRRIDAISPTLN